MANRQLTTTELGLKLRHERQKVLDIVREFPEEKHPAMVLMEMANDHTLPPGSREKAAATLLKYTVPQPQAPEHLAHIEIPPIHDLDDLRKATAALTHMGACGKIPSRQLDSITKCLSLLGELFSSEHVEDQILEIRERLNNATRGHPSSPRHYVVME